MPSHRLFDSCQPAFATSNLRCAVGPLLLAVAYKPLNDTGREAVISAIVCKQIGLDTSLPLKACKSLGCASMNLESINHNLATSTCWVSLPAMPAVDLTAPTRARAIAVPSVPGRPFPASAVAHVRAPRSLQTNQVQEASHRSANHLHHVGTTLHWMDMQQEEDSMRGTEHITT